MKKVITPPFQGRGKGWVQRHGGLDARRGALICAAESALTRAPTPGPSLAGRGEWSLNGAASPRYHGNLNVRREGLDVACLMSDLRDIAFSAGSACASGSGRPSHVLRAIGLTEPQARASIRIGFGRYTTEEELADALDRIIAAADAQRIAA